MAAPLRCGFRILGVNFSRYVSLQSYTGARIPAVCPCQQVQPQWKATNTLISQQRKLSTSPEVNEDTEPETLYKAIELEVKGHDPTVLNSYEKFLCMAAEELSVNVANIYTPPRVIERYTQLKSVHIFKKHRLKHLTGSTADTFLAYLQINLPEGVAMKVTRHRVESIPDHIKPPEDSRGEQA